MMVGRGYLLVGVVLLVIPVAATVLFCPSYLEVWSRVWYHGDRTRMRSCVRLVAISLVFGGDAIIVDCVAALCASSAPSSSLSRRLVSPCVTRSCLPANAMSAYSVNTYHI